LEFFDDEEQALSTRQTKSTESVSPRATMCGRDTIDLRHDLSKRHWQFMVEIRDKLPPCNSARRQKLQRRTSLGESRF